MPFYFHMIFMHAYYIKPRGVKYSENNQVGRNELKLLTWFLGPQVCMHQNKNVQHKKVRIFSSYIGIFVRITLRKQAKSKPDSKISI